jgi:hypothetical protein
MRSLVGGMRGRDDLGALEDCIQHYQRALELCPNDDESIKEKATIIHNFSLD